MPPKPASLAPAAEQSTTLRENEMRFIKSVFDHMTDKPNTDWSKVAEDMGLKGVKCARDRFRQISIRHGWGAPPPASYGCSPVKAAGKKGAAVGLDAKVTKKPRTPKKGIKKESAPEEGDDEHFDDEKKMEVLKFEGDESFWGADIEHFSPLDVLDANDFFDLCYG